MGWYSRCRGSSGLENFQKSGMGTSLTNRKRGSSWIIFMI